MIAQITETTTPPPVEITEPLRPVSDLLVNVFNLDRAGAVVTFVEAIAEPVLQIVIILLSAWIVLWVARRMVRRILAHAVNHPVGSSADESTAAISTRRAQRLEALGTILDSVLGVAVWSIAAFVILGSTFGISLAPLLAGAGILGVALGFGAQDIVKDFLSGFFILVEDQYGIGDIVDVGEATGTIESISLRTTRLREVTGTVWHVPNGEIRRVGNMSQEWSRVLLDIEVAYGADIDRVAEVMESVAVEMARESEYRELFLDDPQVWGVEALGSDSVAIRFVIKTKAGEQWPISRELRRRIKLAFDAEGIEIPFPQRTIWLRTEGESDDLSLGNLELVGEPKG
jgi:small conductance mechanosensitive channel